MSGSVVSPGMRARVRLLAGPVARGFGRLGLTPNHLTFIGFGIAIVAAVAAAQQSWLAAGLLVLFGGVFDLFDGALARATNRVSKLGAFYDSVFDRWGEGVVYIGLTIGCLEASFYIGAVLAAVALSSAVMVSYTRAKSEGLGFTSGTGMASIGLAPREVRIVILVIGFLGTARGGGLSSSSFVGTDWLWWTVAAETAQAWLASVLTVLAILATITTIQRILHVRAQAREG